ncbi:hypothetical protein FDI21_gp296 [Pseudomonas phage Noxifer]|uniref:Uncharacterized protein n=1 Tax=Pseudomonas phage Noxifer TaxID=2006684 RepID=A0A1Y0SXY4_9CAUD|nr:hypothetical protein FDI21_gp296 [Pseudomonas phage Noxifer]ARV77415.1 hypothetical protein NOXIFER_250 [Pseudomonas phage Noxifer]
MNAFRLNIPDPLADERRVLGNAFSDVYKSVMYDMNERYPGEDYVDVVRDCVETAMTETLRVFDGRAGFGEGNSTYLVLPMDMVEPLRDDDVPTLAGSLASTLLRDFSRINS